MSLVSSISTKNITIDPSQLKSKMARSFHDPADKRFEANIIFKDSKHTAFIVNFIINGLTDQPGVKHLMLIEEGFKYVSQTRGAAEIHGHCKSVGDGIIYFPIDQRLEGGTIFSLSVSNLHGTNAITVLSDKLTLDSETSLGFIPFNRRNFLLHVVPGETLDAKYYVTTSENFTVKEITHFERLTPNELTFGTQLGAEPKDVMIRAARGMRESVEEIINNVFIESAEESGATDAEIEEIKHILESTLSDLEKRSWK